MGTMGIASSDILGDTAATLSFTIRTTDTTREHPVLYVYVRRGDLFRGGGKRKLRIALYTHECQYSLLAMNENRGM